MVKVQFEGKFFEIKKGTKIIDFIKNYAPSYIEKACSGAIDGDLKDLRDKIEKDSTIKIYSFEQNEGKKAFWHTSAHILAQAVWRIYKKDVRFGVGPAIENGFYYDIKAKEKITQADIKKIEDEMKKIVKENIKIEREFVTYKEAKQILQNMGQSYKLQLLEDLQMGGEKISLYKQGDYIDLCAGPHLMSTSKVKAIKLINITGAYWRGDAKNEMLDRIYGISFLDRADLKEYLEMYEKAKKVDHRKVGKELGLFSFSQEGPGFAFFMPNGMIIKNKLIDYWRKEHILSGYEEISTPTILSRDLWETSGHWGHYKNNMYTTKIDAKDYAIKPMNCPGSILLYKQLNHSYKELPIRFCELGTVYRHELSGTLHGLMRARCFTQDDAHIFLRRDQIEDEVKNIIALVDKIYKKFGFSYSLEVATMPKDHIGDEASWQEATNSLKTAINKQGLSYKINEGDGAFYGPKIDFYLTDCLKRRWQCGTIQLDFQLPARFKIQYVGEDGKKHTPIMIHRVIFGSIERFIGILTENFAGAFPFFIAPIQVKILPISDKFIEYGRKIQDRLIDIGFRVKLDDRSQMIGYKIRQAGFEKIPFLVILGEDEEKSKTVSIRKRKEKLTTKKTIEEFIEELKKEN